LLNVPYKTTPAAVTDLLGGRIDMLFLDLVFARPLIQAGKLRPLAVTSLRRLDALAGVPTLEEAGLKGYENAFFSGIFAPRGTPQPVLNRLAELFGKANLAAPVEKNRLSASMVEMPLGGAELARYQQSEFDRWKSVVAKAGIAAE
jgi:tripartite-type tricarboxylate transporter receptor subunit TctC